MSLVPCRMRVGGVVDDRWWYGDKLFDKLPNLLILLVLSTGLNKIKALGTALIFKLSPWSSNKGRVAVDAAKCPPADPPLAIILFESINNEI